MIVFLKITLISQKFKVATPDWTQIKHDLKMFTSETIWHRLSNRLRIRVFEVQLLTLVLLQIDVVNKAFKLDQ